VFACILGLCFFYKLLATRALLFLERLFDAICVKLLGSSSLLPDGIIALFNRSYVLNSLTSGF